MVIKYKPKKWLMNNTITLAMVAVVAAVGAGVLGYGFASLDTNTIHSPSLTSSALMAGHIELVVKDPNGAIKSYRQTDNAVTVQGENCVAKMLFGASGGSSTGASTGGCVGANTAGYTYIALGHGTSSGNTALVYDLDNENTTSNLGRAKGAVSWSNSTSGGTASSSAQVTISKTFTSGGTASITEAGLFNATKSGADGMFARKQFSAVSVSSGDQVTVTWTVNIGNTTSFN